MYVKLVVKLVFFKYPFLILMITCEVFLHICPVVFSLYYSSDYKEKRSCILGLTAKKGPSLMALCWCFFISKLTEYVYNWNSSVSCFYMSEDVIDIICMPESVVGVLWLEGVSSLNPLSEVNKQTWSAHKQQFPACIVGEWLRVLSCL